MENNFRGKALKIVKSKYFWMAVYVVFLSFGYLYIRSILKTDALNVTKQEAEKDVKAVKPVRVSLIVELPTGTKEYKVRLENSDSILDLMNNLRTTTDFKYQLTGYLDREEIDFVNGVYPPTGFLWKGYYNEQDITQEFHGIYLVDNAVYYLKLGSK